MKITEDVSKLTGLPYSYLNRIFERVQDCICYKVQEDLKNCINICNIDINIGNLVIFIENDLIKYKFIPSQSFEEDLKQTLTTGESPLIYKLENNLSEKVLTTYQDLM